MKKHTTSIVILSIVAFFAWQSINAQNRDDRYIASYGISGVGTNEILKYGIGIGKGFHVWQGFSLDGLLEFDKFSYSQFQGHTSIISSEPSYSAAFSVMLKMAAPWKFSPYLTGGGGIAYVKRGELITHDLLFETQKSDARWGWGSFYSLGIGTDIYLSDVVSILIELRLNITLEKTTPYIYNNNFILRAGIGLAL